jgi:MoaA/NifB/PqqE/SkfB family radical SAM enzyme
MEDKEIILRKKAEMICSGKLFIPSDITIPFPLSKSSAGPGAGSESIVLSFSGMRVKVPISRESGEFQLRRSENGLDLLRNGEPFISGVSLVPTVCHSPGQAFITLTRACRMNCLFCTINDSLHGRKSELSADDAYALISSASKKPNFQAVAITSGITTTVEDQIERIAELVRRIRRSFPVIPIGVEPLITDRGQIRILKDAGATEIKINIEAASKKIFRKVCPARDYDLTLEAIRWAVDEFGKNLVTSNIIVGLGESDEEVLESIETLAEIGAVGNLRAIRINEFNRDRLSDVLGKNIGIKPDRLLALGKHHREILRRHDLSTERFRTMCFPCGCCDLVPGMDF